MADEEAAAPAAPPAPKSKKSLWLILIVVVVLAGAGGGYFMLTPRNQAPAGPVLSKAAQYYNLDPSIVVNFADKRAIRFLQVGVTLMSHDPEAIKAAEAAEPRIRNALLLLFSSQKFTVLGTTKGKLELQNQALQKVQEVVKQTLGRPGIEAVYFTSFVMQ